MKRFRLINLLLTGLLLGTCALHFLLRWDPSRRNYEVLPEMLAAVPYESLSPNPNFPDGKTLQEPVAGSIARGYLPLRFGTTPEEAIRAGETLVNPIAADDDKVINRGAVVWETFCQVCHGPTGEGGGLVTQRGVPAPPSLLTDLVQVQKDGQIFHTITFGKNNMPGYATQIEREDRWAAIRYLRFLQGRKETK